MDKLKSLMTYVKSDGRVCPMPDFWNELWQMLPNRKQKESGGWNPPLPLILAAWWDTTAKEKRERLILHLEYATDHGILDKVDKFLRELMPDQWAYGNGTTRWEEWEREAGQGTERARP